MKKLALWKQIIIAILLGILVGLFIPNIVPKIKFLGDIFLRLLKMLIAPLVLFTLISGVCKMGDIKQLRTVGMRIVIFYLASSTVSAILGVLIALITQPGKGVIDLLGTEVGKDVSYNFIENLIGWVPINIFEALATGNTLQIIFFALLMGVVLLSLGDSVSVVIKIVDQAADAMMKLTEIVMKFAPIGIFALIADLTISLSGNMLKQVLNMILTVYIVLLFIIFIVYPLAIKLFTKESGLKFLKNITPAMIVAASTTSSAATLPVSLRSSNIYGYPITFVSLLQFVFMGLVLSVGCAGVKGAGIVMSTVLLQTFGMPLTLIPILAAIWPITDIGYTTANITGDLVGTVVVANSLNSLDKETFRK